MRAPWPEGVGGSDPDSQEGEEGLSGGFLRGGGELVVEAGDEAVFEEIGVEAGSEAVLGSVGVGGEEVVAEDRLESGFFFFGSEAMADGEGEPGGSEGVVAMGGEEGLGVSEPVLILKLKGQVEMARLFGEEGAVGVEGPFGLTEVVAVGQMKGETGGEEELGPGGEVESIGAGDVLGADVEETEREGGGEAVGVSLVEEFGAGGPTGGEAGDERPGGEGLSGGADVVIERGGGLEVADAKFEAVEEVERAEGVEEAGVARSGFVLDKDSAQAVIVGPCGETGHPDDRSGSAG